MRVRKLFLAAVFLCFLCSAQILAAEAHETANKEPVIEAEEAVKTAADEEKEAVLRRISELGGYTSEKEKRTFHVIRAEFGAEGRTGYFISAYGKDTRDFGIWSSDQDLFGDVWAVMDGTYTRILKDVGLDSQNSGGMELIDMGGRSFVIIRTYQCKQGKYSLQRTRDRDFLFGFQGENPVCLLEGMQEAVFLKERQVLTAYYELGINEYFKDGSSDASGYKIAPYFFRCENGEFQEIVAEPCTEEEFYAEVSEWEKAGATDSFGIRRGTADALSKWTPDEEDTVFFYRIPGIANYVNVVKHKENETSEALEFMFHMVVDSELHKEVWGSIGPYGFRYSSWQNRMAQEKELCRVMKEQTGFNLYPSLPLIKREEEVVRPQRAVVVRAGDSLSELARSLYGDGRKWWKLYESNKETIGDNPSLLLPDTVLWADM